MTRLSRRRPKTKRKVRVMPRDMFRLAFTTCMSAEDSTTGELMLYGEIVQDYGKWYKDQYPEDKSATDFDKAIKELKSKGVKKLNLRINSPGGIVTEAVAMRAILVGAGFEEINVNIEGMCASAATLIASIPTAHVAIHPGAEYMIHNPWTLAWGNANDMEKTIDHLRQLEATSRAFYVTKTGQSDEQIKEWMDAETWFTAEQAVEYGFADELVKETADDNALPAAACVTSREMAVMRDIYKAIPGNIVERPENEPIRHGIPETSGEPSEINQTKEETTMDIKDLTMEELREGNPDLIDQIKQEAVEAERERLSDIDALTVPGYEELAEQAKANGTSALEFQKQIVAAMRKKGADFLKARTEETAPAQQVTGGAAEDEEDEEKEVKAIAESVAEYAKAGNVQTDGMF